MVHFPFSYGLDEFKLAAIFCIAFAGGAKLQTNIVSGPLTKACVIFGRTKTLVLAVSDKQFPLFDFNCKI
jgi:hypothetical protein